MDKSRLKSPASVNLMKSVLWLYVALVLIEYASHVPLQARIRSLLVLRDVLKA